MARKPLNPRQVEVLHWIADGCPEGVWQDSTYKTTAVALHNRRLVTVSKRGGWHADMIDDGRYYLEHGRYPEEAPKGPGDRAERGSMPTLGSQEAHHQQQEQQEEEEPSAQEEQQEEPRDGQQTIVQSDSRFCTEPEAPNYVEVPDNLRRPHQVVAALRDDKKRFDVVGPARARALRVVQGLIVAAEAQGWQATLPQERIDRWGGTQREDGDFVIDTGEYRAEIRVEQEKDRASHVMTASEERARKRNPWVRIPEWDYTPTERLRVHLPPTWGRRGESRCSWGDGKRGALVSKLPGVLEEIARRSALERDRRLKREEEEVERGRRWQAARDRAERLLIQTYRADVLSRQAEDWRQAARLREYVQAMRDVSAGPQRRLVDSEWVAWAAQYCEQLDPLNKAIEMPVDPEPTTETLRPFMGGWSPHGPAGY